MTVFLSSLGGAGAQFFDNNGDPLTGGKLYSYAAGTTTPQATYTTSTGSTPHANPIVLDAAGRVPNGEIWLTSGSNYKFVLTSSADVQIAVWDNITGINGTGASSNASVVAYDPAGTGAVATTVQAKLRENMSVLDFGAVGNGSTDDAAEFANAKAAAGTANKRIIVPTGTYLNGNPSYVAGDNVIWDYIDGGNSRNVLNTAGDRGGPFADYDCTANRVMIAQINENQSVLSGGGFRDAVFINAVDTDSTNYTAIGQKVTYGIRSYVNGNYSGSSYAAQYKDLVGGSFLAIGNVQWDARGTSAITADAIQYGSGITSNEFSVFNPAAAAGGVAQSKSMAAIQAILKSQYADEDATHISRILYLETNGKRITNGIQFISNTVSGFTSLIKYGINMSEADIDPSGAAIVMGRSLTSNAGTTIEYDTNTYTNYNRSNATYNWVISGGIPLSASANGIALAGSGVQTTRLYIGAGTTGVSQMRFVAGVAPTAPADGDVWFDGTNLRIRISGVTRTFTVT